ncbi:MAG: C10 family peptidase [Moraxellaceae bacterium]|nr:C10 family peptidase [Moraxellaceae bacterium]
MKLALRTCIISTILSCVSVTVFASDSSNQPILQKSEAITMAINFAKVQPYENKKVEVKNLVVNDIKDFNGVIRSYEISLFDETNKPVGYINVPNRAGFDAISNYSFHGISKTENLQKRFAKQVELAELATGNKAFFVGSELGAIAIAVKLDGKLLTPMTQGYQLIGDYAVFSQFPKNTLKSLTKAIQQQQPRKIKIAQLEETKLRQKLLNGDTNIEQAGNIQINKININKLNTQNTADIIKQNAIAGILQENQPTEFKGYNQYSLYKDGADKECTSGCTPTAYMMLLDYWDRNGFPKLIAGSTDRAKYPIKNGSYYGAGDNRYYVTYNSYIADDDMIDEYSFDALLKVRKYLKTDCNASTLAPNVWRGEKYIQDVGYNAKVKRVSGLFGNKLAWDKLKSEIDAGRPVLFSMTLDGTWFKGHSAVAYGYKDVEGTEHDKIYVVMGLGSNKGQEIKRNAHIGTTSVYISEKSKPSKPQVQPELSFWQKIQDWFQSWKK